MAKSKVFILHLYLSGSLLWTLAHASPAGQGTAKVSGAEPQSLRQGSPAPAADPLSFAFRLYSEERFHEALKVLESLLKNSKSGREQEAGWFLLGECYQSLSQGNANANMQLALDAYEKMVRNYPSSPLVPKTVYRMAEIYRVQKRHQKAIFLLRKHISKDPASGYTPRCLLSLGRTLIAAGKESEGIQVIEEAMERYPSSPMVFEARSFLIGHYVQRGNDQAALVQSEKVSRHALLSNHDLGNLYAESLFRLNRFEEAREIFFKLTNLYPGVRQAPKWMARIGDAYAAEERKQEALTIYYQARDRYPGTEGEVMARAGILDLRVKQKSKGVFENVLREYGQLVQETRGGPQEGLARMLRGTMLCNAGHFRASMEDVQAFLESAPQGPQQRDAVELFRKALVSQIRLSYEERNDLDVIELVQKHGTYRFDPPLDVEDEWRIAESHWRGHFPHAALRILERIKQRDDGIPNEDLWLFRVGRIHVELGDTEKGAEVVKQLIEKYPKSDYRGEGYALLGKAAYLEKKYPEAVQYCKLSLIGRKQEQAVEVHYILGSAYWMQGDLPHALEAFQACLDAQGISGAPREGEQIVRTVRFGIGDLLYDLGRHSEAFRAYEDAVSRFPQDSSTAWARYRIGLIHLKQGRLKAASETLKDIQGVERLELLKLLIRQAVDQAAWAKG